MKRITPVHSILVDRRERLSGQAGASETRHVPMKSLEKVQCECNVIRFDANSRVSLHRHDVPSESSPAVSARSAAAEVTLRSAEEQRKKVVSADAFQQKVEKRLTEYEGPAPTDDETARISRTLDGQARRDRMKAFVSVRQAMRKERLRRDKEKEEKEWKRKSEEERLRKEAEEEVARAKKREKAIQKEEESQPRKEASPSPQTSSMRVRSELLGSSHSGCRSAGPKSSSEKAEKERFIEALRSRIAEEVEAKKLTVPPLCFCVGALRGEPARTALLDLSFRHHDNCEYHHNTEKYMRDMSNVLSSLETL